MKRGLRHEGGLCHEGGRGDFVMKGDFVIKEGLCHGGKFIGTWS